MKTAKYVTYLNLFLILTCFFGSLLFSAYTIMQKDLYGTLIRLSIIPLLFIPNILAKVFKIKITDKMKFLYLLFLFLAHFLGSIANFYHRFAFYDTFTHFLSGAFTAFIGIYLFHNHISNKKVEFVLLLAFSALIAISWETFEFVSDNLFGKDAQNVLTTGVDDTMIDMLVALLGSVLLEIITFWSLKKKKKNFLTDYVKEVNHIHERKKSK